MTTRSDGTSSAPVIELHAEVDERAAAIARRNASRITCRRGCSDCCVDDLTVFEVEAARIRSRHPALLATAEPHPEGACAFLDGDGACRIYDDRPYVCRTQGLPLRWTEERDDGLVELRDICPLNVPGGAPLTELDADDCWSLGPFEGRLATLEQARAGGGFDVQLARVRLRDLFASRPAEPAPATAD